MSKFKSPVKAFTSRGKLLVFTIQLLLNILHWLKGKKWQSPPPQYNDDPRHFSLSDLLYFAYKYYYKSPIDDDVQGKVIDFFKKHPPIFERPNDLEDTQTVTITAAGDLMPYEWIQPQFCSHLWDDIAADFFNADITFANLETPIDLSKPPSLVPEVMLNDMLFNADEKMFSIFNGGNTEGYRNFEKGKRGFDILSTANNHSLDMGEKGVYETINFLKKRGITPIGTHLSEKDKQIPTIIEKNGIRVAFLAYTFSMNKMVNPEGKEWLVNHIEFNMANIDLNALKKDVKQAKNQGSDIIILSLHAGNAYQPYPAWHNEENIKRIFEECGVDIILGGHPHNVQPMAGYNFSCPFSGDKKKGFVLFSFGDFVAYDIFTWGHLSVYLKLTIEKNKKTGKTLLTRAEAVPIYAKGEYFSHQTRRLEFLLAEKWLKQPHLLPKQNADELEQLMAFYNTHFCLNLRPK